MTNQNKFTIEKRSKEGIECLHLSGYLDAHTAPELETAIGDTMNSGKNNILVVMNELDYISSAGLGVFMAFIEEIREKGGDIKISNLKPKVFSVFDLLGFPMLFDIEKDESMAIMKFKQGKVKNIDE